MTAEIEVSYRVPVIYESVHSTSLGDRCWKLLASRRIRVGALSIESEPRSGPIPELYRGSSSVVEHPAVCRAAFEQTRVMCAGQGAIEVAAWKWDDD